jgi:hypothetical protein
VRLLTNTRLRLTLLLLVAVGLGAYAFTARGGRDDSDAGWCERPTGAPSLTLSAGRLQGLARQIGLNRIGDGAPFKQGIDGPSAAWTDARPVSGGAASVGGGWEMAWRGAAGSTVLADMFPFASAANAADYVAKAGRAACRSDATSRALAAPSGARTVTWTGPDGRWQSDIFVARGTVAWRVSVIAAAGAARPPAPLALLRRAARSGGLAGASSASKLG